MNALHNSGLQRVQAKESTFRDWPVDDLGGRMRPCCHLASFHVGTYSHSRAGMEYNRMQLSLLFP